MSENMKCAGACSGCALTPGATANLEPDNNLRATLAVLGAFPFYCHRSMDWENPEMHKMSRGDVRERGVTICQGWKRDVAKLAQTGYYKDRGQLKRELAIIGIVNLEKFLSGEPGSPEKKEACEILRAIVARLSEVRCEAEGFTEVVDG